MKLRNQSILTILPARPNQRRMAAAIAVLALTICMGRSAAFAGDIDSAKRQLEKVKVDVGSSSWDSVEQDIKSTEEFLDGLPDAERAPVQKELDALKAKAMAGLKENKSKFILETSKRDLDSAADDLTSSPARASEFIDKAIAKLTSDDAKKYVEADALKKLLARATSLQTMSANKTAGMKLDFAAPIIKELDEAMAAGPFKAVKSNEDMDHVSQQLNSLISRIRGSMEGLPPTDARVKAINDKLAGYQKQIASAEGGAMASQAAENLAHQWKAEQEYFAGWELEKKGPTWDQYLHEQSDAMSNLQMPKTVELLTRMNQWFDESGIKPIVEQYKDDKSVKATLAEAHKAVDTAAAKLHAAFSGVLDGAEKVETPKDSSDRDKAGRLAERADMWLKGTQYHDQDVARAKKLAEKWAGAMAGDAAALDAALTKLTADATTAWPAIAGAIKAEEGFTPDKLDQFKGKIIHLKGNNRLGWDYMTGAYQFAKEINGMPVAGKFDAKVAAAVEAVKKQTGQELPDEGWDLYATVEGPGRIKERKEETGKVKIDGQEVGTVTAERNDAIPCAVVRIFALHVGPVAVGSNSPAVAPAAAPSGAGGSSGLKGSNDAAVVPAIAGTTGTVVTEGSSSFKKLEHFAELLLCLAAAALVMMKSGSIIPQSTAGTGSTSGTVVSNDNIAFAGLAIAVLGVLWLLAKLIFGDLLPALSLTLAGVYISADWLRARNVLPQSMVDKTKPLGIPIAGATAIFGVLHLFLSHVVLF